MAENEPEVLSSTAVALGQKYHEIREQIRGLEKQINDLDAEKDQVALELRKIMEDVGMQRFNLKQIGTFYLQATFYPKVIGDPLKVIAWLDGQGASNIAPRTIHKPAFKEFYQSAAENDKPLPPPDLVEAHTEVGLRLRGTK
jgi:hypothetical protein